MVPITVVNTSGEGERGIERGGRVLGLDRARLLKIGQTLSSIRHVATHREPDFDGLFSAWAVNVIRGQSRAPIYTGHGSATGIEKRVPGLLSALEIRLEDISKLSGAYALFDAGNGSNKNVGASYEPIVCVDTHFGAGRRGGGNSIVSARHAAVSTIVTAIIYAWKGERFWDSDIGAKVAAGLLLGIQTDCGMNNPTASSMGLYGTSNDRLAFDYLRHKADSRIIGAYVASAFWSQVDSLVSEAARAISQDSQSDILAVINPAFPKADSDLTGVVAERLLDSHPAALFAAYGAFLVGGGFKVSFRLNPAHSYFDARLVRGAIKPMVAEGNQLVPGGEASWRSEGRVLGGFWPAKNIDEAKAVMSALLGAFQRARNRLVAAKRLLRRGRGASA